MHTIAIVLVGLVGVTGCGKDSGKAATAGGGGEDLCRLVTAAEAGALLGGTAGAPQRISNPAATVCVYPGSGGEVRIMKMKLANAGELAPKADGIDADSEHVPGIGDDAYVVAKGMTVVRFRKGLDQIAVFVSVPNGPKPTRETLVDVGTKAASRL